jgi:hypothetical protein
MQWIAEHSLGFKSSGCEIDRWLSSVI